VDVALEGDTELPVQVKVALYRIAQEALANIAKHSEATQVKVVLRREREAATLIIEDNGRGFDPATAPTGRMGLQIMLERAESIGAGLTLGGAVRQGTKVKVVWPADEEVDQ
jgi:signal transduction histidine kinase